MSVTRGAWTDVWLRVLLVVAVLLTVADITFVAVLATTSQPEWVWSLLSVSPWGPILLVLWALVARHRRNVRSLRENGIRGRATVVAIGSTASQIGGRPVLRLTLSVPRPDAPAADRVIRTAPPYHLAGMLRPGTSLPVALHPERPDRLTVLWDELERETARALIQSRRERPRTQIRAGYSDPRSPSTRRTRRRSRARRWRRAGSCRRSSGTE